MATPASSDALLDYINEGVLTADLDGRILGTNSAYCLMSGYSAAEILQMHVWDLEVMPPEQIRTSLRQLTPGEGQRFESAHRAKDGHHFDVEVSLKRMPGSDARVVGVIRDITERKQAVAEMERRLELQEQISKIAATVPGAIYTFCLDKDGRATVPYASPNLWALFATTAEEANGDFEESLHLVHPQDRESLMASILESARTLEPWRQDFRVAHPIRGELWLEGHSVPRREPDGSTVWVGYVHDVTERRELEAQLRQAQKMDAVGLLAGGIAHDFNNLMMLVGGYCEFLLEDGVPEPYAQHVHEIRNAARRATDLTGQLLAFSRRQASAPRAVDLEAVVGGTLTMLTRLIGDNITLQHPRGSRPLVVLADSGQLEQVLMNLCVNARDAMPDGGTIEIEVDGVDLAADSPRRGRWARLRVRDTGCGIAAAHLPRIFEPFFTTKDIGKGTGLGLATVYGIVEQHRGWIDVESDEGKGTEFRVFLPLHEETGEGN